MRNFVKQDQRTTNSKSDNGPATSWKGLVKQAISGIVVAAAVCSAPAMAAPVNGNDVVVAQLSNMSEFNGARVINANASGSNIMMSASATPMQDVGSRLQFGNQFSSSPLAEEEADWMSASRTLAILFVALVVVSLRIRAMTERSNRVH